MENVLKKRVRDEGQQERGREFALSKRKKKRGTVEKSRNRKHWQRERRSEVRIEAFG